MNGGRRIGGVNAPRGFVGEIGGSDAMAYAPAWSTAPTLSKEGTAAVLSAWSIAAHSLHYGLRWCLTATSAAARG